MAGARSCAAGRPLLAVVGAGVRRGCAGCRHSRVRRRSGSGSASTTDHRRRCRSRAARLAGAGRPTDRDPGAARRVPATAPTRALYNEAYTLHPAAIAYVCHAQRRAALRRLRPRARGGPGGSVRRPQLRRLFVVPRPGHRRVAADIVGRGAAPRPGQALATVGAGAHLIDVYSQLGAQGMLLPGGSCPTVGIAGLALGGGVGVFGRAYGLTCDQMPALEMVTADGTRAALRPGAERGLVLGQPGWRRWQLRRRDLVRPSAPQPIPRSPSSRWSGPGPRRPRPRRLAALDPVHPRRAVGQLPASPTARSAAGCSR